MINEKTTFEKFGYFSTDLPITSYKKVIVICDNCNKDVEKSFCQIFNHTFCNNECSHKYFSGSNNPNYKEKIIIHCDNPTDNSYWAWEDPDGDIGLIHYAFS
jgi:hypothetical protein